VRLIALVRSQMSLVAVSDERWGWMGRMLCSVDDVCLVGLIGPRGKSGCISTRGGASWMDGCRGR
jgi:hypothetical protein